MSARTLGRGLVRLGRGFSLGASTCTPTSTAEGEVCVAMDLLSSFVGSAAARTAGASGSGARVSGAFGAGASASGASGVPKVLCSLAMLGLSCIVSSSSTRSSPPSELLISPKPSISSSSLVARSVAGSLGSGVPGVLRPSEGMLSFPSGCGATSGSSLATSPPGPGLFTMAFGRAAGKLSRGLLDLPCRLSPADCLEVVAASSAMHALRFGRASFGAGRSCSVPSVFADGP
mmetsp:Transcript_23555/g.54711  ORF Transcript_23555/g.54711 Transcript_23555/m.54711 type:complete len:232 (+) Transcript_23555:844-1539(+)